MRRAQARAGVFAESAGGKIVQGALHVREVIPLPTTSTSTAQIQFQSAP
jgi:hypothetical protein